MSVRIICIRCGTEFEKTGHSQKYCKLCSKDRHEYKMEYDKTHKDERRASNDIYRVSHKEERKTWSRIHSLKSYEFTIAKWNDMLIQQSGRDAITNLPLLDPTVDHCIVDGKIRVRGLLNRTVNSAIGLLKHNPHWLREAANYIERNGRGI